jgi:hypothetical protein
MEQPETNPDPKPTRRTTKKATKKTAKKSAKKTTKASTKKTTTHTAKKTATKKSVPATAPAIAEPVAQTKSVDAAKVASSAESVITDDMIRERAYLIWLGRGCTPGDPAADWIQAEIELRNGPSLRK